MRVLVVAGALLAAACLTLSAGAALRANSQTYSDSTGEDAAAPDITTIVVSNDDNGLLTFQINIANRPQLIEPLDIGIFLDTDLNAANGAGPNFLGAELLIDLIPGDVAVGRWNGSRFDFSGGSPSSLAFSYANGATIKVKASDLGLTTFNFYVAADSDRHNPDSHLDFAPDSGHGIYNYQVKLAPPTVTPPAAAPPKATPTKQPLCKKGQKSTKAKPCRKK
jgi:hypothetical protein